MSTDIESRLQQVRTRQQESQRRHAQAEAKLDAVRAQKEALMKGLKDQGFETVEDARKRVQELSAETETLLAEIEQKVQGL